MAAKLNIPQAFEDEDALPDSQSPAVAVDRRMRNVLVHNIDPEMSHWPLLMFCAATGYMDTVAYTATRTFAAFQTGNTITLSIALASLFSGREVPTSTFTLMDGMALVSLLCFLAGTAFAALLQVAARYDVLDTRGWHFLASLLCAALTFAASILLLNPSRYDQANEPSCIGQDLYPGWTGARGLAIQGFLSASLGLQGAIAKRLSTPVATSVVLTSVWMDLLANPNLFPPRLVRNRGQRLRVLAIFWLFAGGFAGRAILGGLGGSATLGIGAGLRVLIACSWFLVPSKQK